ncbi:hypothetical protein [Pseudoteredinibacter isoporae]|uniref:Outer membrane protein assembly factor BamE (Lipoprotein component of BamABCDE complex) n=1 Tax=Pseudoteredinibacter isoporae TaxID=570281 RepID=A0A7X0JWC6_9GAMM|nr:hypothetical protein [Pseudoteredinibacter isoporae]MBB6523445.1 outer membrane protein assembly factor BamE (lipoprotein component of BamABCDE complex) [Pseudoteredinibacter isoporae]NHO88954.1 hypothetical protein [Pseudoteredinibacter isoporae]NIB24338.1 hypothetical protein [Pseudoteredinibacter isoporae]
MIRLSLSLLAAISLSACTIIDRSQDIQYSTVTQPVSAQALSDIRPGKTNSRWLLNNIGLASEVEAYGERKSIWRYDLNEIRRSRTKVALLYSNHERIKSRCQLSLLLVDDIVSAMWSGNSAETLARVAESFKLRMSGSEQDMPMCESFRYIQAD